MIRAKVIAAAAGAFLIAFTAEAFGIGTAHAGELANANWANALGEGVIAALGAFGFGYVKRETRDRPR